MIDNKILGQRIKYFRKRSKMSQFDLENEIGASAGVISRIESGKVNPTKETVREVARKLDLNHIELDYLIGATASPATKEEIEQAKLEVQDYLNSNAFGYLIDERWRLCAVTESFSKFLEVDDELVQKRLGTVTMEFVINPDLGLVDRLSSKHMQEMLDHNLRFYYREVGFMQDDEAYQKVVQSIQKHEIASKLWGKITRMNPRDIEYSIRKGRILYFKATSRIFVPFTYTYEHLLNSSRFKVVEYTPHSKFAKFIHKLMKSK